MEGRRESEGLTLLIYQILRSRDEKRDLDRGDSALSPVQWWLELFFVGSSSLAQPGESWLLCLQPSLCLIHPQCWTLLSTLDVNRQTYSQILIKYSCFSLWFPQLYISKCYTEASLFLDAFKQISTLSNPLSPSLFLKNKSIIHRADKTRC